MIKKFLKSKNERPFYDFILLNFTFSSFYGQTTLKKVCFYSKILTSLTMSPFWCRNINS